MGRSNLLNVMYDSRSDPHFDLNFLIQSVIPETEASIGRQDRLSRREREILRLVAEGSTLKEIASMLSLFRKTVEYHNSRPMEQPGLYMTAESTMAAPVHGLIPSSE